MTYCVAIKVNDGIVFAADTRTAAGVDDVRTYNKLHVLEVPGERVFVILSAGNLATTQYVLAYARREMNDPSVKVSLRTVRHMFDAADYLGQLSVRAQKQSAESGMNVNVETTLILGGQIMGEDPAIYLIYPLGNCIAASRNAVPADRRDQVRQADSRSLRPWQRQARGCGALRTGVARFDDALEHLGRPAGRHGDHEPQRVLDRALVPA